MKSKISKLILNLSVIGYVCSSTVFAADSSSTKKKEAQKLLNKRNVLALPSVSSQVSSLSTSSKFTISSNSISTAANGTPPALKAIPNSIVKDIFWRKVNGINVIDGLIAGLRGPEYCGEFFSGANDGQSGGLGACHLAESVGYSYSVIVDSGRSLCYVQNFPTTKNLKSGGISVNSGALPSDDIEKLFSPPSAEIARVVKVNVVNSPPTVPGKNPKERRDDPETIFIEVPTASQNKAANNIYQANLWFCSTEGGGTPMGYDLISVSNSLKLTNQHLGNGKSVKDSTIVNGFLVQKNNKLIWNDEKSRNASAINQRTGGDSFRSDIEITSNNLIKLKRLDNFGASLGKSYIVTKYSGNDAENLRFLKGAYNEVHNGNSKSGATEFRFPFYANDEKNAFSDDVQKVSLDSDFYNSGFEIDTDTSRFSCTATPDIELTMDLSNTTVKDSLGECLDGALQNMHFCHDDPDVSAAEAIFKGQCPKPM